MASYFRFEFLFAPTALEMVGTTTPRWTSYVGTREGVTADDENAKGWMDCTGPAWFDIVGEETQTESWTAGELYLHDEGKDNPPYWYVDSVKLTPTAAFLALGEPTAMRVKIRTDLRATNDYGPTVGAAIAFTADDYPYGTAAFAYADLHGNVWKVADLRVPDEAFSYLFVRASETTAG